MKKEEKDSVNEQDEKAIQKIRHDLKNCTFGIREMTEALSKNPRDQKKTKLLKEMTEHAAHLESLLDKMSNTKEGQ